MLCPSLQWVNKHLDESHLSCSTALPCFCMPPIFDTFPFSVGSKSRLLLYIDRIHTCWIANEAYHQLFQGYSPHSITSCHHKQHQLVVVVICLSRAIMPLSPLQTRDKNQTLNILKVHSKQRKCWLMFAIIQSESVGPFPTVLASTCMGNVFFWRALLRRNCIQGHACVLCAQTTQVQGPSMLGGEKASTHHVIRTTLRKSEHTLCALIVNRHLPHDVNAATSAGHQYHRWLDFQHFRWAEEVADMPIGPADCTWYVTRAALSIPHFQVLVQPPMHLKPLGRSAPDQNMQAPCCQCNAKGHFFNHQKFIQDILIEMCVLERHTIAHHRPINGLLSADLQIYNTQLCNWFWWG